MTVMKVAVTALTEKQRAALDAIVADAETFYDAVDYLLIRTTNARALNPDSLGADYYTAGRNALAALPVLLADTARLGELEGERDAWKQNAAEWAEKLRIETARMDWLAQCRWIQADARVMASDGLPAAMDWEWNRHDDGPLRVAIDATMEAHP